MSLQKNTIIPLTITGMSHEGEGIGRSPEGIAVFVPMAAIGDTLNVRIVKVLKNRAYGIIDSIVEPSPSRMDNDCPYYKSCGGCSLRHITPEAELALKGDFVRENMARLGGISIPWEAPLDTPQYQRYRNKAAFPVRLVEGRVVCGFFAKRSHRLIPIADCRLQPAIFAAITDCVCSFCERHQIPPYHEEQHTGLLRHIVIRHAAKTGELMLALVINGDRFPKAEELLRELQAVAPLTTVLLDHNTRRTNVIGGDRQTILLGDGSITDELRGIQVKLSAGAFYQVNRDAAELLYGKALEYADPGPDDIVLDLYCGTGTIGLSMAHRAREIIGVEIVGQAVENAVENAALNGISNARFLCMDAGKAAEQLAGEGLRPSVVLLDPPRKGIDEHTIQHVSAMNPRRIVYVSCNSATLARDCALLREKGYVVTRGCAVNLFARTAHVEAVVLLSRL